MVRQRINPPLSLYKKIALTFIAISLVLIAVIFYFAVSYAYVTVYPKTQPVSSDFTFSLTSDATKVDPSKSVFAGSIIDQTFDAKGTFDTKGTLTLTQGTVGTVTVVNNYTKVQPLVATTRLLTPDGVLYRIKDKIIVPAHGSVTADIYADDPAKAVAITKGTHFTIPGLWTGLQDKIYAESTADFVGEKKTVTAVTKDDIDSAIAAMTEAAISKALGDQKNLSRVLKKDIIKQQWSAQIGDQVQAFTGDVQVHVTGVAFDETPVKDLAQQSLKALIPQGKQLASIDPTILYDLQKTDPNSTLAMLKGTATGTSALADDNDILDKEKFTRLQPSILKAYLENFDTVDHVDISFFPSWNKIMPRFADHIVVKIVK